MPKNIMQMLSLTALTTLSLSVCGDTIYKCKNQQGSLLYQKSPCKENAQTISSWTAAAKVKPPADESEKKNKAEFIIKQNQNGYYFLDGAINGKALTFVIDTGASFVSLPDSVAREALIFCKNKVDMQTANGTTDACSTTIEKLNFGPFEIKDVMAVIAPNLTQPLLGMNVLQQLKIAQEKGEMRLSTRE
ncbi:MAG: TIGR02281 family clan AA aspartic protease [Methylococcaceae bacterium]|nr:TIGR02281 family clan AA aspartic protease [Methylococcaceae bacterium]